MNKSKPLNAPLGTVRRKPNFLPSVFVNGAFDALFLSKLANCFETLIIRADREGDTRWEKLTEHFRVHGLTELKVPQELILDPIHIEIDTRDGGKRSLSYTSKAPLSYGFETLRLDVERTRVSDCEYRAQAAAILAYMFAWRLFPEAAKASPTADISVGGSDGSSAMSQAAADSLGMAIVSPGNQGVVSSEALVLLRLDATALNDYLRKHHRGQVSSASLTQFLIGRTIQPLVDDLPALRMFDDIIKRVADRLKESK